MCFDLFFCCSCICNPLGLPRPYVFMEFLGEGSFGYVMRCQKKDTKEMVAVKISKNTTIQKELNMMEKLMSHNLHQHNIVRFLGPFTTSFGTALVMEELDYTLWKYLFETESEILPLHDIRNFIKQMATALDALKSIGVIHGDIKPDNIMIVDHQAQPLRVKLIDFGIAMLTSEATPGMRFQHPWFRAPEIILGLPFTEAIDIWSLGCIMALMFVGEPMFLGASDFSAMQYIVYHCGHPPDHLLNKGLYTKKYFTRTETNEWKIKQRVSRFDIIRSYELQIIEDRLYNKSEAEEQEARQCLDLLRAMLRVDPTERITPAEVLSHPFIDEASASAADDCTNIERDHRRRLSKIPLSRSLSVDSAEAENSMQLEREESLDSWCRHQIKTSRPVSQTSTSDSEDPATAPKERKTTNIQPAHRNPSPSIPRSRVIYVQPARPENTMRLEDQESLDSLTIHTRTTSRLVSWTSTSDCEDPATALKERETTNIQPAHHSPLSRIPPSRVIYVQPARPENRLRLEDQESADSLQAESPVTITGSDTTLTENDSTVTESDTSTLTPEDFTIYRKKQLPQTELSFKKKKKKNCFRHFFCCCVTGVDDD